MKKALPYTGADGRFEPLWQPDPSMLNPLLEADPTQLGLLSHASLPPDAFPEERKARVTLTGDEFDFGIYLMRRHEVSLEAIRNAVDHRRHIM